MAKKENKMSEEKLDETLQETVESDTNDFEEIIQKLTAENAELKNQYFKAYADAENYQKRVAKELENGKKYRIQSFATKILPAIDNLERALSAIPEEDAMRQGVVMIYDQLMSALKEEGVEEINALDQDFDGNFHQSLMAEKVEGVEPGKVIEVFQKGYLLKDRILRASLVKISE